MKKEINVLIVPETPDFKTPVSHENIIWINKNLGEPKLKVHNALYVAPYWVEDNVGVTRIFHIRKFINTPESDSFEIILGNSFVLEIPFTLLGQKRRFEYRLLSDFGFAEICPGLLLDLGGK